MDRISESVGEQSGGEPDLPAGARHPAEGTSREVLVRIDGELTISNAADWQQRLLAALEPAAAIAVDLGEVQSCDTAGLQLICSLRKSAIGQGRPFRIHALSPAVRTAAGDLGLPLPELTGRHEGGNGGGL